MIFLVFLFLSYLAPQEAIATLKTSEELGGSEIRVFPNRDVLEQLLIAHTKDTGWCTWAEAMQEPSRKEFIRNNLERTIQKSTIFKEHYPIVALPPMPMNPFIDILIQDHFRLARENSYGYWNYLLSVLPGNTFTLQELKLVMSDIAALVLESQKESWGQRDYEALNYEVKVTGSLFLQLLLAYVPPQKPSAESTLPADTSAPLLKMEGYEHVVVKEDPGVPSGQLGQAVPLYIKPEPGTTLILQTQSKPMRPPSQLPKLPFLQGQKVISKNMLIKQESGPTDKRAKIDPKKH